MNKKKISKLFIREKLDSQSGVTLLEILVVLAIITMLATLVGPRLMAQFGKAKSQTAVLQIDNISSAVQLFYVDMGRYPSENEGLLGLFQAPIGAKYWSGPYLKSKDALRDPWDRPYVYLIQENIFVIKSLGRDGQADGSGEDADLTN